MTACSGGEIGRRAGFRFLSRKGCGFDSLPEQMALVLVPKESKLIPNPRHGDEWIIEMY